jgi:hypothetical protein
VAYDPVAGLDVAHFTSHLDHVSGDFMAKNPGKAGHQSRRGFHDHDRQTNSRSPDANLGVTWTYTGFFHFRGSYRTSGFMKQHCPHSSLLQFGNLEIW